LALVSTALGTEEREGACELALESAFVEAFSDIGQ